MAIVKTSPSELSIHGGGPPSFASKLPVFAANVGDGHRFAELAERMFIANETPGRMVEEFESALAGWLGVRNVIGFSSQAAAIRCLANSSGITGKVFVPAFGATAFQLDENLVHIECEPTGYGMNPEALGEQLRADASAVFSVHPLGRPGMIEQLDDLCDEWGVPLFFLGHQALGSLHSGEKLGSFGRAEIFELGRDQLVHAMDSAIVTSDDDLLAHRLRGERAERPDGIDQSMSDAAAAMGIANLESAEAFAQANRPRYEQYREFLADTPGIKFVRHDEGSNYQSIAIQVDPGLAGITRDAMSQVLACENVGTAKPFEGRTVSIAPVAAKLTSSLLQLPAGPSATEEAIKAVCKLVELAIVRSLESPDPIRLAA